jgi:UDP-2-acetamido-2,6-beta-L-arabino-hexul-4-ose reductase
MVRMNVEVRELSLIADERGWLAEILNSEAPITIGQIHFSVSKIGAVRGNHYHSHKTEWLFITSGTGKAFFEDNATKEKRELTASGNHPVLIKISPNTTHAIVNSGNEPMHLIAIQSEKYTSESPDTYRNLIFPIPK